MKIARMNLDGNDREVLLDLIEQLRKSIAKKNSKSNTSIDALLDIINNKRNG